MGYGIDNASGLDLFVWAQRMGLNPWHVAQLADPSQSGGLRIVSNCNSLVYERGANDAQRIGRRDIRQAIEATEQRLADYLGTYPSPRPIERIYQYPQLSNRSMHRVYDVGMDGRWLSVQTDHQQVQALGAFVTGAASTENVTYTDEDGDGYSETATVTATVPAGTLPAEVYVQFTDADSPLETRRIAPRSVSISGTTATIIIDSWGMVKPIMTSGWAIYNGTSGLLNATIIPPTAGTPYAAEVDVGRERCDPTGTTQDTAMALLVYETRPCPFPWGWCCESTNSTDPAATRTVIARATLRNPQAGIVALGEAVYDAVSGTWSSQCNGTAFDWRCYPPDRIILRYCAGYALDGIQMAEPWATVVARMAAADLTADICGCQAAQREIAYWQFDTSRTEGTTDQYQAHPQFGNPFGSRRGHVFAWQQITRLQRLVGIIAG